MPQNHVQSLPRFLRLGRVVHELYGISRSAQYDLIKKGKLRPPRKISPQVQGWLREELEQDLLDLRQQELLTDN